LESTACEATDWVADTAMICRSAIGLGATRRVLVTVGIREGTVTEALSFNVPVLGDNAALPKSMFNVPSTGSISVTVVGADFGTYLSTLSQRVGVTACQASDWQSDTSTVCRVASGVHGTLRVAVTAGVRVGSVTEAFSFDLSVRGDNAAVPTTQFNVPSTGSISVTVIGADFGTYLSTLSQRVGMTTCEASDWQSDTSTVCRVASGVHGTLRTSVTVGLRAGTFTELLSYSATQVDNNEIIRPNFPASTPTGVTVEGIRFGSSDYTPMKRIGFTSCEETRWEADTSVMCMTAAGVFGTRRLAVTVGMRLAGTSTEIASYDVPMLSSVRRSNRAMTGSASITVEGLNFYNEDYTSSIRMGFTAAESTEWESDTSLRARSPQSTLHGTRRLAVTAGQRVGTQTEVFSWDLPSLSSVQMGNRASTGSTSVTIQGHAFSEVGLTFGARIGHTSCESSEWESDTQVRCRFPSGVRGTLRVAVTAGQRAGTLTEAFSFDVSVRGDNAAVPTTQFNVPSTGSISVTVIGADFGTYLSTLSQRVGMTTCEASDWQSDTSTVCRVASGVHGTLRTSVTVGLRAGTFTELLSYSATQVDNDNVIRPNFPASTPTGVTVEGIRFGSSDYTAVKRIGFTSCEETRWEADTSVMCMTAAGLFGTRRLAVTVGIRLADINRDSFI
jgi:hypothetical protein